MELLKAHMPAGDLTGSAGSHGSSKWIIKAAVQHRKSRRTAGAATTTEVIATTEQNV